MKRTILASVVALSVVALSACGSDDDGGSDGGDNAGGGGMTSLTVGVLPVPDTAAIYLGVDQGFFEEEGLEVELQPTTGGAAAVPGVVSGTYDFAFGNYVSGFVAADQGLPLKYVSNATTATEDSGFQAVVVPLDSPIQSPADLSGKRVAVNNLANINDTTIRGVVDADGGDSSAIDFVEVAFPDAVAAVTNKQVDAATVNPWTSAMDSEFRVITYNFTEFTPNLAIAGMFTTEQYMAENADVVESFQKAMEKSLEFAQENPDEVRRILGEYTRLSPEAIEALVLPIFATEINRESLEELGAAAAEYGTIDEEPDLDALLP